MSADRIAADLETRIRSGDLPPGARLLTHRDLAREHGVALNTATRAMRLLAHRGLVTGEVGRGSFVRAPGHADGAVLRIEAGPPGVIDRGGNVMPLRRREAVAALARRLDFQIIEDDAYGFLAGNDEPPPLAVLAPERTWYARTTSKTLTLGLRTAWLMVPPGEERRAADLVRATV